jgi:cell filamentation protein
MQQMESEALVATTERMIDETDLDHRFTAADLCALHEMWLGSIYEWAGVYRSVNISKDGFVFAAVMHIPRLMQEFEQGPLNEYTPCHFTERAELAAALAITHAELILIHPFREGNGRCARLLSTLMGLQAGLPPLNFGGVQGEERRRYIGAIHASMDRNYEPIVSVFDRVIRRSLRSPSTAL